MTFSTIILIKIKFHTTVQFVIIYSFSYLKFCCVIKNSENRLQFRVLKLKLNIISFFLHIEQTVVVQWLRRGSFDAGSLWRLRFESQWRWNFIFAYCFFYICYLATSIEREFPYISDIKGYFLKCGKNFKNIIIFKLYSNTRCLLLSTYSFL